MKQAKSDYEEYLEKYCKSRGFCREEAERHAIVREVKKMCEEREANANTEYRASTKD